MPAGLVHLSEKYGRLPLAEALKPAIRYAQQGFVTGTRHQRMLNRRLKRLQSDPESSTIFLNHKQVPQLRSVLTQFDLASSLIAIASKGKDGFYSGEVANKLVTGSRNNGGIWTLKDLTDYRIIERPPIYGSYHGIKIVSAAPPSSGGIVLIEALNILEGFNLEKADQATRKHLIVEAMRRAYRDRAFYLGDPDYVSIPQQQLLDKNYAAGLRTSIRHDQALSSSNLAGESTEFIGGQDTTHFSIIDSEGNRVSATLSINFPFGSGIVAPGTGVLLNNEMDDFVSLEGALNGYGLTGGSANSIEPGKRMLSSMTPTFLSDKQRIAVLGTPGGSRIISMVLLATLDFAEGNGPESWTWLPRFHHQFLPDEIQYEKGALTHHEIEFLSKLGHEITEKSYHYGNMQGVMLNKSLHTYSASSDPRGQGLALIK
jgi:gamma-glutamyltranspeptidase/glutathione hydrolase